MRQRMNKENNQLNILKQEFPSKSPFISYEEFLAQTGIDEERYAELTEIGWLKPAQQTESTALFLPNDIYKVRKLEKISKDFEIQALPSAIIVDLLERVENLEQQIQELSARIK